MGFDYGSIKELENVSIKLTAPLYIGDRFFDEGETVMRFDYLDLIGMNEISRTVTANGGFGNRAQVYWTETKEMNLAFSRGVFNKVQFALMNNAKMLSFNAGSPVLITAREQLESDERSYVILAHEFVEPLFVYDATTGEKLHWLPGPAQTIIIDTPFTEVIVDYQWEYTNGGQMVTIGSKLLNGFLSLEATTNVKDDQTGQITTGLLKIPKIKLVSTLSMRLGTGATPIVTTFQAVALPVGERHESYVMELTFLNNDIDSDM